MKPTLEQEAYAIYDRMVELCASVYLTSKETRALLSGWLTQEAARSPEDDSLALLLMKRIVEVYDNDTNS